MSSFALAIAGFQVNEAVQNEAFSGRFGKHIQVYNVVGYLLGCSGIKIYLPSYKRENS